MKLEDWNQRYLEQQDIGDPTELVRTMAVNLPPGRALDLASGPGRNALWLAAQGWEVTAVDGAPAALSTIRKRNSGITAIAADLEAGQYAIEESAWDLVVIAYYLQRDLLEPAKAGVTPGGILIVIVHTTEGDEEPTAHRLRPGELADYFVGWEILHQYEGAPRDAGHRRRSAEVAARKPRLLAVT